MGVAKFCNCRACRQGRKDKMGQAEIRKALRSFRRQGKLAVKNGNEPPVTVGMPHTD